MVDVITKLFEVGLLILILCNRNTVVLFYLRTLPSLAFIREVGRVVFLERPMMNDSPKGFLVLLEPFMATLHELPFYPWFIFLTVPTSKLCHQFISTFF